MKKVFVLLVTLFLVTTGIAHASYPDYKNYVNDYTGTLSQSTITQLDKELFNLQKQNTDQVAVAMISTTGDESIEDYSIHLTDKWKPGQKGKDNGILFLIAKDDHKMRIEVGRGLEGVLTDVQAKDIETNVIAPEFKAGDYDKGVTDGTNAIIRVLGGHVDNSGSSVGNVVSSDTNNTDNGIAVFVVIIIIMLIIILLGAAMSGSDGSDGFMSGALTGGIIGGLSGRLGDTDGGYSGGYSSFGGDSGDSDSFGGFSGGSFSGGGASASW